MFRWGLLLLLIYVCSAVSVGAAELSQRDWMEQLTDSLGWGYGLPDDPVTEDYIALLSGERRVHVEAEGNYRRSDRAAVKRLTNYGTYSGSGWVSGRQEVVQLHFDILVPRNGRYQLSAVTRLPGVTLQVAGQKFVASAGQNLTRQTLGQANLTAGQAEVVVTLPPNAGIDYFRLSAPPQQKISPLQGWQPDRRLDAVDLAMTMLQALNLLSVLPRTGQAHIFEAEAEALPQNMILSADRHLGPPSGGAWARAGNLPAAGQVVVALRQPGCFQLVLRGASNEPVDVRMTGYIDEQIVFGPALTDRSLGRICLPNEFVLLEFDLPPRAGIDKLELQVLDTGQSAVLQLLGIRNGQVVDRPLINELLQLLSNLTH